MAPLAKQTTLYGVELPSGKMLGSTTLAAAKDQDDEFWTEDRYEVCAAIDLLIEKAGEIGVKHEYRPTILTITRSISYGVVRFED